ncbi:MAG: P-loop NTPase, partial [Clostridia bacterium]|nr:P-loop NTPase [Clostridia bacterium]
MKHVEKILVTSLKGGVGKSTVSAALAAAFAGMGSRVLLCDLDFRSRSLELMIGAAD